MNCLEITTKIGCIDCSYCPQQNLLKNYRGNQILTYDKFKKYIKKIPNHVKIHFSGFCEPFLNKECIKFIEYCFKHKYKIGIYTTTIGLKESVIKKLKGIKIDPFILHFPDTAANINLKFWESIFRRKIELLNKYKIKYKILSVTDNIEDRELFKKIKFDKRNLILQPKISRAGNLFKSERKTGILKCDEERYNQNILLPNGNVYICCMDYGLKYKLGNLNKDSYNKLFKSIKYKEIIEGLKDDTKNIICRYCNRANIIDNEFIKAINKEK